MPHKNTPHTFRPKRSVAQLDRDRMVIAAMYLKGMLMSDIAKRVGVSMMTISRDLKVIREDWRKATTADYDTLKMREIATIDLLERTHWEAWERSTTATSVEKVWDAAEEEWFLETTEELHAKPGDPRFLSGVRDCVRDRCDLLGIKPADRLELTGKDGGGIRVIGGIDLDTDI